MSWITSIVLIGAMLAIEAFRTLTPTKHSLGQRWLGNVAVFACNNVVLRMVTPASAAAGATFAAAQGWGLFNRIEAPMLAIAVATFLTLDAVGYVTHRIEHKVPLLWRTHRTHHSDPDLDVSTGLRFHPAESLWRDAAASAAMVLLGPSAPIAAGCAFGLGLVSLVSHVNAPLLPTRIEQALQAVLVTPRVHRIHHSVDLSEANSNYGVALSIWDRMLGTYRAQPNLPFEQMRFGVTDRSTTESLSIPKILIDPVRA